MPGMNGAEFLDQVRKKAPDTLKMFCIVRLVVRIAEIVQIV